MNKLFIQIGQRTLGLALLVALIFDVNDEDGHAAVAVYRKNGNTLYFQVASPEYEGLRLWMSSRHASAAGWLVLPNAAIAPSFIRDVDLDYREGVALSLDNGPIVYHRHGTMEAEIIAAFVRDNTTFMPKFLAVEEAR